MPIYEYKCSNKNCNYQFEIILKIEEAIPVKTCPNCKDVAHRIPTAASFRFGDQQRSPNHPDNVAEATEERKQRRLKK